MLWDKNHAALYEYVRRRPCTVITVRGNCLPELQRGIEAAGGSLVAVEDALTQEEFLQLDEESNQRAQLVAQGLDCDQWKGFCEAQGVHPARVNELLTGGMKGYLHRCMIGVKALDRLRERYQLELMLVNEEYTGSAKLFVKWAKARGVPVLHLLHGTGLAKSYNVHDCVNADCYAVGSDYSKEGLLDLGAPDSILKVTGFPAWDHYRQLAQQRVSIRSQLAKHYRLDPQRRWVGYFTTWASTTTAYAEHSEYKLLITGIFLACVQLWAKGVDFQLIIKDRESNERFGQKVTAEVARALGIPADAYRYITENTEGLTVASDVVVSSGSNLSIEAGIAGIPAINLLSPSQWLLGPPYPDVGMKEARVENLAGVLEACLQGEPSQLQPLARFAGPNGDGRCFERVAELMLRMAQGEAVVEIGELAVTDQQMQNKPTVIEIPAEEPAEVQKPTPLWQQDGENSSLHGSYYENPRGDLFNLFAHPPRIVLELGCGTGATGQAIKQRYPDALVMGFELNKQAAAIARERLDWVVQGNIEQMDLASAGFRLASIDTFIAADVLEHLYNPWLMLHKLRPFLTDDAQVITSIPNSRNAGLLRELAGGSWTYRDEGLLDWTHIRFFTRQEIEKLFSETGYRIACWESRWDGVTPDLDFEDEQRRDVDLGNMVLKNLSREEWQQFRTLQFVVRAEPLPLAGSEAVVTPAEGEAASPLTTTTPETAYEPAALLERVEAPMGAESEVLRQETDDSQSEAPLLADQRLRIAFFVQDGERDVCWKIRVREPFSHMADLIEPIWATHNPKGVCEVDESAIERADVIVVQRHFPRPEHSGVLDRMLRSGKPVYYETDDLFTKVPEGHDAFGIGLETRAHVLDFIGKASGLIVSTEALKEAYLPYNKNISVLPTVHPAALIPTQVPPLRDQEPVTIGYVGTVTHLADLRMIEPVLLRIHKKYGKRVRFVFVGCVTPKLERLADRVERFSSLEEYLAKLPELGLDIGLAPLQENDFNRVKSNIKWIEYTAAGAAGVYSNLTPYLNVQDGRGGFVVPNTEDAWREAIENLINDPQLRHRMLLSARERVLQECTVEAQIEHYREVYSSLLERDLNATFHADMNQCYAEWVEKHQLTESQAQYHAERMMTEWRVNPGFHLLLPFQKGEEAALADTLDSLSQQLYSGWGLSVVSQQPSPGGSFDELEMVEWVQVEGDLMQGINAVLSDSSTDWVALIAAGDRLAPDALISCGDYINLHPQAELLYIDEDWLDDNGQRYNPLFKPEFNLELLRSMPYLGAFLPVRRELLQSLGGYAVEPGVAQYDLALKLAERAERADAETLLHIPKVLLHRQDRYQLARDEAAVVEARCQVLLAHLQRCDIDAKVQNGISFGTFFVDYPLLSEPLVSIILPFRDLEGITKPAINTLLETSSYANFELLLVDNGSREPSLLEFVRQLERNDSRVRLLHDDAPFNYSAICNRAVQQAQGDYLLFLDSDTMVVLSNWLERLLAQALRPQVGVVGPRLIYTSERIESAGLVLGMGGDASSPFVGISMREDGYMGRLQVAQEYSAVSGSCLLIRRELFDQVGGLDEQHFGVRYSDVDLCLKVKAAGYKVIWTPFASLVHFGRQTIHSYADNSFVEMVARSQEALVSRHLPALANDPAFNPNLSLLHKEVQPETEMDVTWEAAFHPRPRVWAYPVNSGGGGEYRVRAPLRALEQAALAQISLLPNSEGRERTRVPSLPEMARAAPDSLFVLHGINDLMIRWLDLYRKYTDTFLVFSLDDNLFHLPQKGGQKNRLPSDMRKRVRRALKHCHRLIVTTEPLKEVYQDFIEDIWVMPNRLETQRWGSLESKRGQGKKPRVGWAGAAQHRGDLELIRPVMEALQDEVEWVFMGMCPTPLRPLVDEYHDGVPFVDYPQKLASLNLDLAIAPLEHNKFNEGKSNLRLLEYGTLGWPVICSDVEPYRNSPATCLPNKPGAWEKAIRERIHEPDALADEGDRMRAWVRENHMLEDHLEEWMQALFSDEVLRQLLKPAG
jgi:GT2 family glycosyltransferase/glycosyltransferase involved in cell wall biosynthesis/trans-aconitate methyltransferase